MLWITTLADSRDHDPIFGISDANAYFAGFHSPDREDYARFSPCYFTEGDKGNEILLNSVTENNGVLVASRRYMLVR